MTGSSERESHPEYVNEVPYLRTFSNDLSPTLLRLVAALRGVVPPPAQGFDHGELGCGNGDTTVILAAANPGSRFTGVDISPEHIAFASGLAERGSVGNARFLERDFEALAREDLPPFHFLCAHGVLSWISPDKRQALLQVASAKLRPGGLFHVSYNAMPGWASIEPLRRILQEGGGEGGGGLDRAARGLNLARLLHDAGAEYFAKNPTAKDMLSAMTQAGLPYIFHEYFQPSWHPMYFSDVAREMARHDLHFVGQLPIHWNYRKLALSAVLDELFRGVEDRLVLESLKDFAVNETFRRDVFVKGPLQISESVIRDYMDTTPFGTFLSEDKLQRTVRLHHTTLSYEGPLFDALVPALARRAQTVSDLASQPEMSKFGIGPIREAVHHLLLGGQILPMVTRTVPGGPQSPDLYRLTSPHNRAVLERPLSTRSPAVLAVPSSGMGFVLTMLEAVCLRLVTEVPQGERPAWLRAFVERRPLKLFVDEKPVESAGEQAAIVQAELARFLEKKLPKLVELGVLEPAVRPSP